MPSRFVVSLSLAGMLVTGTPATASAVASGSQSARHVAVQRWKHYRFRKVYYANLDDDGRPDRVVISNGKHLGTKYGLFGWYRVTARLTSTGQQVRRALRVDQQGDFLDGTPWLGTADIDHVGGNELLLSAGEVMGRQFFHVLAYWHGGLRLLPAPDVPGLGIPIWLAGGEMGGADGFHCTSDGIAAVQWSSIRITRRATRFRVARQQFIWRDARWVRTLSTVYVEDRKGYAFPPRRFDEFVCRGLRI